MKMEIMIGIISLLVCIIIAIIPYFRRKYFQRPKLTIELIKKRAISSPLRLNQKYKFTEEVNIDAKTAIRIFELTWRFTIGIINNSDLTAFYPELEFNPHADLKP